MPNKFRKAFAAVKDSTRIGLAKVANSPDKSNLQVAILKATSYEEAPIEDRYIDEILHLTSSNKSLAAKCARALSKRLGRTRNWIVALKALVVSLHLFRDGDPHFPREVLVIMKGGGKFLNLRTFRDDCTSSPWEYTAFVRTIAGYLTERLDCFVTGRLLRRMGKDETESLQFKYESPRKQRYSNDHVRELKPVVMLERITSWQRLLDKAMTARPTGAAKDNGLVQLSMYAMLKETFDLYRDISDSIEVLLDSFFHLPHQICQTVYQTCIRSSEQFKELNNFYAFCKEINVGRHSEYPTVQPISEQLMETLQEFLKDLSSFPNDLPYISQTSFNLRRPDSKPEPLEQSSTESRVSRQQMSLEDFLSVTEPGTSSPAEDFLSVKTGGTSPALSMDRNYDMSSLYTAGTSPAMSVNRRSSSFVDLSLFEDAEQTQVQDETSQPPVSGQDDECKDDWEILLAETASKMSSTLNSTECESFGFRNNLDSQHSTSYDQSNCNNPFLTLGNELSIIPFPGDDHLSSFPTFQATPTFSAQNPNETSANDLFILPMRTVETSRLIHEQQLWLQTQNEIIAKRLSLQ